MELNIICVMIKSTEDGQTVWSKPIIDLLIDLYFKLINGTVCVAFNSG